MLFSSLVFVFGFLPTALAGYYVASKIGHRVARAWLIAASLVFYGWWNPAAVTLLLLSILVNYAVATLIMATESHPRLQSWIAAGGISANLAALFYYKYLFSVMGLANYLVPAIHDIEPIVLPLGISFFTFTQIGYLVDCKAGVTRDRNFLNYMLFVTFFPHLIAGPLLHNRDIMPQFADRRSYGVSAENLSVGLSIFAIGLAKKCIFADPLSEWVASGYAHTDGIGFTDAWTLAVSYSLQLYFDFSGYSDMAIGLARTMNIRFPVNFNSPYKAQNVIEYWQRWHITLTKFLTTYLYTPLAIAIMRWRMRNKFGINRPAQRTFNGFVSMIAIPLLVTMTIAGIWHGSGITFLIFGAMHGVYLCVNHALRVFRTREPSSRMPAIMGRSAATYLSVLAASVFFRAPSVGDAVHVLTGMTRIGDVVATPITHAGIMQSLHIAVLYSIIWLFPNTQQIMRRFDPTLEEVTIQSGLRLTWTPNLPSAVMIGIAASVAILLLGGTTEFLYFRF